MRRLRKFAEDDQIAESLPKETDNLQNENSDVVKNLLMRIDSNVNDIKTGYYSLLENMNALNKDFPGVYNELKVMVKLPNKNEINNISDFKNDIENAVKMLSDETFLSGLIK